jgi:SAM-dependent methyltransferase
MAGRSHSDKAATRGEPSYVWRAGQERRLGMIRASAPMLEKGRVLVDGCGLGAYVEKLGAFSQCVHGLDIEFDRVAEARRRMDHLVCGAGEYLPYASESFDAVLSNEVIEHVQDDGLAVREMVRMLRRGGRLVLFCPNRWYPVETHGIYWRGRYIFGNIPFVNYLPNTIRNRLAPHVRAYTGRGLRKLFDGLPVKIIHHSVIFGGYDNLVARFGPLGKFIRAVVYGFENTPLQILGLSHFLVIEKTDV